MVYFKGKGIVESWKWLWASIRQDWKQYGVYAVTRWALELAVGLLSAVIIVPVAVIFIAILVAGGILAAAVANTSIALAAAIGRRTAGRAGAVHRRPHGHIDAHRGLLPVLLAGRAEADRPVSRHLFGEARASAGDAARVKSGGMVYGLPAHMRAGMNFASKYTSSRGADTMCDMPGGVANEMPGSHEYSLPSMVNVPRP